MALRSVLQQADYARRPAGKAFCIFAAASAIAFAFSTSIAAPAGGLTLECSRADVVNAAWNAPITLAFEGSDRGTLKVGGVFGEFAIPASRAPMELQGEVGEAIDGVANARVKLPSLSDLEACIGKADAGSDAFANARDSCLQKLPAASSGVDAVAQIRIGIGGGGDNGGEDAFVVFKLIYSAPSRAPDGKMVVEAFPAQCKLMK